MNHKFWQSIVSRLSLSLCLLLLLTAQPALASAGAFTQAWNPPEPRSPAAPVSVQSAVIEALNFTAIATGRSHTCALTMNGGVKCWGNNENGQLGDGTTLQRGTPVDVSDLASGVTAIAVGGFHTCALTSGDGVKCWGHNGYGQLGDGTTNNQRSTPVDVVGLDQGVTAITAGEMHTCALTSNGGVKCWGNNYYGQLGDGTTNPSSIPLDVVGLTSGMTAITAGWDHTCALTSNSEAKCWGSNSNGQLGDGTTDNRSTPVDVTNLTSGVTAITAGGLHTCALTSNGGVKCWGANGSGQLGDGTTNNNSTPVDVTGLASGVTAITAGGSHTCALTTDGGAKCWGYNGSGQLGDRTTTQRSIPVDVTGLANGVTAIAAGESHTCALTSEGGVKCWGNNESGQLGDGTTAQRGSPVDVTGLTSGVTAIAAGRQHTCALTSNGGVKCWGNNQAGQLGDGTQDQRSTPVDVVGLTSGVTAIALGGYHTCALVTSGGVKCWGSNYRGQLGDGTTDNRSTPVDVVGLAIGVTVIGADSAHTCAAVSGGGVKCWGENTFGQLGDGTRDQRNTPVDVVGLTSEVTALTAGYMHTCALTSNGAIKCWGNNWQGQLGDGTTNDSNTPVDVDGLASGVIAISAGEFHSCALTSGGGVKCWGANWNSQLGDGTTDHSTTPVDVTGLASGITAINAGWSHVCGLANDGRVKCWGWDGWGQLGIGTITQRLTPVDVVESTPPLLTTNYSNGQPGSFFTLTGWNFPPNALAALSINGQAITTTITVNPYGSFIFFLSTSLAEPGGYDVTVSVITSDGLSLDTSLAAPGSYVASTSFFLTADAPLHPQEGGGLTFLVPAGIALEDFLYLPLVGR